MAVYADSGKKAEAELVSAVICTLLFSPELTDLLTTLILGAWAFAEAAVDVRLLLDGKKVELIKKSGDWNISLLDLFTGNLSGSGKGGAGLSYQDYLSIFLGLMNRDMKVARSLDIVEMDLRQTAGNEQFRIDRCMDYMKVNFGFQDAGGHEYVFYKKMCYGD